METRYKKWLVSRWLEKTKKNIKFLGKEFSNRNWIFLIVDFPMRPELVILSPFVRLLRTQNWLNFFGVKWNFELIFLLKGLNLKKKCTKSEQNQAKYPVVHTKLQPLITPRKKRNSKKSFHFPSLRWTSFLMIPLTILYDEYIDQPKLTEQKNPFEYIVPPPTSGVGTKIIVLRILPIYTKKIVFSL